MKSYNYYEQDNITYLSNSLSSVLMIQFDRQNLDDFLKTKEANKPGVYILYNESFLGQAAVYIGETENAGNRFLQHKKAFDKTFWTKTILFQTSNEVFNKAHYKTLENMFYKDALFANRVKIINSVTPNISSLSNADKININIFYQQVKGLLISSRFFFLEHPQLGNSKEDLDIYYLYHELGTGKLQAIKNEFYLLKDSVIVFEENDIYKEEKLKLLKKNTIQKIEGTIVAKLNDNIKFTSENEAAAFVTNNEFADWTLWKNRNNEKLH